MLHPCTTPRRICVMQGIEKLAALKHLSAADNDIRTLTLEERPVGVAAGGGEAGAGHAAGAVGRGGAANPAMSSVLESLYLAKNDIASLEEVLGAVANASSTLLHLSLAGNPCARANAASPRDKGAPLGNARVPPLLLRAGAAAGVGVDARNNRGGGVVSPREGGARGVGERGDASGLAGPEAAQSVLRELDVDVAGMVGGKGAGEEARSYKWRVLVLLPALMTLDGEEIVTRMREEAQDIHNRLSLKEVR